jgi:hypothetical protein
VREGLIMLELDGERCVGRTLIVVVRKIIDMLVWIV